MVDATGPETDGYRMKLDETDDERKDVPNGVGRANGPRGDVPLGRWFRYPAGFSSDSLDRSFNAISVPQGAVIVDPFAGVATAGVGAVSRAYAFHGIESHSLIAELGQLKFARPGPPEDLVAAAAVVARRAASSGGSEVPDETSLVESAFPKRVLRELVAIRQAIRASRSPWRAHMKWALLGSLRDLAVVNVGWPYQRPTQERVAPYSAAVGRFQQRAAVMAEDLKGAANTGRATVVRGDSRLASGWALVDPGSVSGCVSSPPYLNNFDYADATRLELYFWGEHRTWQDVTKNVRSGMVRAATHQTTDGAATAARERLRSLPRSHAEVEGLESPLAQERAKRPRGKEYDRLLVCYSADMLDVLQNLFRSLRPGAQCAWTIGDSAPYGVYIDTPALIGLFASEVGFEVLRSETLRSRGLRWRTNGSRHQVALCEKVLVFRKLG